jgi:hypothetical protein
MPSVGAISMDGVAGANDSFAGALDAAADVRALDCVDPAARCTAAARGAPLTTAFACPLPPTTTRSFASPPRFLFVPFAIARPRYYSTRGGARFRARAARG